MISNMKIIFNKVKYINTPFISFLRKKESKSMLGRWGSVKNKSNSYAYGYDCANEFSNIIITNKEKH